MTTVTQVPQMGAVNGAAGRYARAFYDYVSEQGGLAEVVPQVRALRDALGASDDLRAFLNDVRIDQKGADRVVGALVERFGLSDAIRRLVGVVSQNGRLALLGDVLDGVLAYDAALRGESVAEIRSAQPLSDAQRVQLQVRLAEAGYSRVALVEQVDPALIGGMTVRVGSTLFDTSIAGRLTRLQNAMKGAA
nr:ATP synthase F1 subunit delta [uncultured Neokomagataea sp.]